MKDVLWEPEDGTCSSCGQEGCVRRYSSDGQMRMFCFPCWDADQEPRVMSSQDWSDEDRVIFAFPPEEPPSRAA